MSIFLPKDLDCFKVLSSNRVAYMDLISSGNETSAHTMENGRITFMFCSFEKVPNILRLYGKGFTVLRDDPNGTNFLKNSAFIQAPDKLSWLILTKVQTSCGFRCSCYMNILVKEVFISIGQKQKVKKVLPNISKKKICSAWMDCPLRFLKKTNNQDRAYYAGHFAQS